MRGKRALSNPCPLITVLLVLVALLAFASSTHAQPIRFQAIDIYVDAKTASLAAYQLEVVVERGHAKIAGIEGGESDAFKQPPYYDPKAMQQERVILAAFNTAGGDGLPKGKTRVATIHVQISGSETPEFAVKLNTAGTTNGKKISATATWQERKAQ